MVPSVNAKREGPGLAKTRGAKVVERIKREWVRCNDYHWRALFESADTLSEGAIKTSAEGSTYFGSTHIHLRHVALAKLTDDLDPGDLFKIVQADPHVRLRAVRLACLEAMVRANAAFSSVSTEITFRPELLAICISVDIEAKLARRSGHRSASGSNQHKHRS